VGLPNDLIFLSASFKGFRKKSDLVKNEMIKLKEKKEKAQPTKIKQVEVLLKSIRSIRQKSLAINKRVCSSRKIIWGCWYF
jgi:hypothetical protein